MGDEKGGGVEAFGIGIGFGVAEEPKEKLGRLLGPASAGDTKLFTLSTPSSTSSISPHRHRLLVLLDVLQESDGARELHAVDGLSSPARVLEIDTQERPTRLCGFRNIFGFAA